MAYYVLVINCPNDSIDNLKQKTYRGPGNTATNISLLEQYLTSVASGNTKATLQISIRDTDPTVTTSGTGSVQTSHSKG